MANPALFRRLGARDVTPLSMMNAAVFECMQERRPVCVLDKPWRPVDRDVPQKWRDEAAEHLNLFGRGHG